MGLGVPVLKNLKIKSLGRRVMEISHRPRKAKDADTQRKVREWARNNRIGVDHKLHSSHSLTELIFQGPGSPESSVNMNLCSQSSGLNVGH